MAATGKHVVLYSAESSELLDAGDAPVVAVTTDGREAFFSSPAKRTLLRGSANWQVFNFFEKQKLKLQTLLKT